MKANHFFNMLHSMTYAVKAHTENDTAVARGYINELIHDCQKYLLDTDGRSNADYYAQYKSEGARPDGFYTVLEWLVKHSPETLDLMEDLAIETSGYGIRASRMCKAEGLIPVVLDKPAVFADDDHFETVKAYPEHVLARVLP